jgi:hypothetical protein
MKKSLTYDDLRRKAVETRARLFERGDFPKTGRRVRKKPRPTEGLNFFFERAIEKMTRCKPYYDKDGKLVLPYFLIKRL